MRPPSSPQSTSSDSPLLAIWGRTRARECPQPPTKTPQPPTKQRTACAPTLGIIRHLVCPSVPSACAQQSQKQGSPSMTAHVQVQPLTISQQCRDPFTRPQIAQQGCASSPSQEPCWVMQIVRLLHAPGSAATRARGRPAGRRRRSRRAPRPRAARRPARARAPPCPPPPEQATHPELPHMTLFCSDSCCTRKPACGQAPVSITVPQPQSMVYLPE